MQMAQGIYESVVPLTAERHGGHSVSTGADYAFCGKLNVVPLLAVEFPESSSEYAIAFAGLSENLMPVAILGLRAKENLFVGADGSWRARYKPAFIRRYPFVFSLEPGGQRAMLCIDEKFAGLNRENAGNRLFDADGQPTPYVSGILKFLQEYQLQLQRTRQLCRRLQELNLLSDIEATVEVPDGSKLALTGMLGVDRTRLKSLEGSVVAELLRQDVLELIFLHLHSLRNLGSLRERFGLRHPRHRDGPII
jgi:hypothetical protein